MKKIQIFHEWWKISIKDNPKFSDPGVEAETDLTYKIVSFRKDATLETVRHEVCHIIYHYMVTVNLNLNMDQQEEFLCEFIQKHGPYIEKLTKKIYRNFK